MYSVELILNNSIDIENWGENVDNWLQINDIAWSARAMTSMLYHHNPYQSFTAILQQTKVPAEIDPEKGRYWKFRSLLEFGIKLA